MIPLKTTGKRTEYELVLDALRRLDSCPGIEVSHEVPILGRSVDLAYLHGGDVVTVEFKLNDWRRAVNQARDHLLGADYSYVCMPERRLSTVFIDALKREGIGLLFYRSDGAWPFEAIIDAHRSEATWEIAREEVSQFIRANQGNGRWEE